MKLKVGNNTFLLQKYKNKDGVNYCLKDEVGNILMNIESSQMQGVIFMTNRDLLEQAMPMNTLTRQEWIAIQEHAEYLERTEKDSKLCNAVKQLLVNQARLEVRSSYLDHFNETLDDDVRENKIPVFI